MTQNTAATTSSTESAAYPSAERRIFVLLSIALVAVMFVGMVGLLYWRERPAPSALLVLRVPPAQDGAIATVDTTDGRDLSPIITTLEGGKEIRIPLPPGTYSVIINSKIRRIHAEVILSDGMYYPVIIDDLATQPTTRGSTKR